MRSPPDQRIDRQSQGRIDRARMRLCGALVRGSPRDVCRRAICAVLLMGSARRRGDSACAHMEPGRRGEILGKEFIGVCQKLPESAVSLDSAGLEGSGASSASIIRRPARRRYGTLRR
jgi:hypothetical protein